MILVALTVLLAVGVFIAQFVASRKSRSLADTQDALIAEKDRIVGIDSQAKDVRIADALKQAGESNKAAGEANERAGKAQASLASAEQQAAEANAKAEKFRLDIATANKAAAEANETAEKERLARIQLEASLADRVLTPDAQSQLARLANEFPNGIHLDVCTFGGTLEVANISQSIIQSLNKSGWTIRVWQVTGGAAARGILIGTSPSATDTDREAAQRLIAVLRSAGIDAGDWKYDDLVKAANSGMRSGPGGAVDAPILAVIGTKR
jgi:hypothetical protein